MYNTIILLGYVRVEVLLYIQYKILSQNVARERDMTCDSMSTEEE